MHFDYLSENEGRESTARFDRQILHSGYTMQEGKHGYLLPEEARNQPNSGHFRLNREGCKPE
jgi:hypothetical protein